MNGTKNGLSGSRLPSGPDRTASVGISKEIQTIELGDFGRALLLNTGGEPEIFLRKISNSSINLSLLFLITCLLNTKRQYYRFLLLFFYK